MAERKYRVSVEVLDKNQKALSRIQVQAYGQDSESQLSPLGPSKVTDLAGRAEIRFLGNDVSERNPNLSFRLCRDGRPLRHKIIGENEQDGVLGSFAPRREPVRLRVLEDYVVEGRVLSTVRPSLAGLRVEATAISVGCREVIAEAETDADGRYSLTIGEEVLPGPEGSTPDLILRAYSGKTEVARSPLHHNLSLRSTIDLLLDEKAAGPIQITEWEALRADCAPWAPEGFGELQENKDLPEISYLARKSGWDARAIALAVHAERTSKQKSEEGEEVTPDILYALFRFGVPAEPGALAALPRDEATRILERAVDTGMIPAKSSSEIAAASDAMIGSGEGLLSAPPLVGRSTLGDLTALSLENVTDRKRYARILSASRADPEETWVRVREELGAEAEARLRTGSALAHLTHNNADLIRRLHEVANGRVEKVDTIARLGLGHAERWLDLIDDDDVPIDPRAPEAEADRARYAEVLAARVRAAFPMEVAAQNVRDGIFQMPTETRDQLADLVAMGQDKIRFDTGDVHGFLRETGQNLAPEIGRQLVRLRNLWQVTPNDAALAGLMNTGFDNAREISAFGREGFVQKYSESLGGPEAALKVQKNATAVTGILGAVGLGLRMVRETPPLPRPPAEREMQTEIQAITAADEAGPRVLPQIASALGSLDFCACESCQSLMSPAAYFTELCAFLDIESAAPEGKSALEVLEQARPDLANLLLDCPNTNIEHPATDLVLELLEHFVVSGYKMAPGLTRNTPVQDQFTEYRLSPQFVDRDAYLPLSSASYPLELPLELGLLTARTAAQNLPMGVAGVETSLRELREAFDDSESPGRAVLDEELGIGPQERRLLTDPGIPTRELLGVADVYDAVPVEAEEVRSAKSFAQRFHLDYKQLMALLKTRFVNPGVVLVARVQQLDVSLAQIAELRRDPTATLPQFAAGEIDASAYDGDPRAWLVSDPVFPALSRLIVLRPADEKEGGEARPCDFAKYYFDYAIPDDAGVPSIVGADFRRMALLIRIQRLLGWSIEATDSALAAFLPEGTIGPGDGSNQARERLAESLEKALDRLTSLKRIVRLLDIKVEDIGRLIGCFAALDHFDPPRNIALGLDVAVGETQDGAVSAWRQIFGGTPGPLPSGFELDQYERLFPGSEETYMSAETALRAAAGLDRNAYDWVLARVGLDASAPLSVAGVSNVLRWGWFASRLDLGPQTLGRLVDRLNLTPFGTGETAVADAARLASLTTTFHAAETDPELLMAELWSGPDNEERALALEIRRELLAFDNHFDNDLSVVDDVEREALVRYLEPGFGSRDAVFLLALVENSIETTIPAVISDAAEADLRRRDDLSYDRFQRTLVLTGLPAPGDSLDTDGLDIDLAAKFRALVNLAERRAHEFLSPYASMASAWSAFRTSSSRATASRREFIATLLAEARLQAGRKAVLARLAKTLDIAPEDLKKLIDDTTALPTSAAGASAIADLLALGHTGSLPGPNWRGQLVPTESGAHIVRIDTDATGLHLEIDGAPIELQFLDDAYVNVQRLEFIAGRPIIVEFRAASPGTRFAFRWSSTAQTETAPGLDQVLSEELLNPAQEVLWRLRRVSALAKTLGLEPAEIVFHAQHPALRHDGASWLAHLGSGSPASDILLGATMGSLAAYAATRQNLGVSASELLEFARDPGSRIDRAQREDVPVFRDSEIYGPEEILETASAIGLDIRNALEGGGLSRLFGAIEVGRRTGMSTPLLKRAVAPDASEKEIQSLVAAVRLRAGSRWRDKMREVNDALRLRRRDALVAHILQVLSLDPTRHTKNNPESLSDLLLTDVLASPDLAMSRIRFGVAACQRFVRRCLSGLEPDVPVDLLDTELWDNIGEYRVFAALMKIWTCTSQVMFDEVRDTISGPYKKAVSEMRKGDLDDKRATDIFLSYLNEIETLSKLEPVGLFVEHLENGQTGPAHVVSKSPGPSKRFYYRKRKSTGWMPWEEVGAGIDDVPVIPCIWKGRLFLFWLRLTQKPEPPSSSAHSGETGEQRPLGEQTLDDVIADPPNVSLYGALCWCERLESGWSEVKSSDHENSAYLGTYEPAEIDRTQISLKIEDHDPERPLILEAQARANARFVFSSPTVNPQARTSLAPWVIGRLAKPSQLIEIEAATLSVAFKISNAVTSKDRVVKARPNVPVFGNWNLSEELHPTITAELFPPAMSPFLLHTQDHVFWVEISLSRPGFSILPEDPRFQLWGRIGVNDRMWESDMFQYQMLSVDTDSAIDDRRAPRFADSSPMTNGELNAQTYWRAAKVIAAPTVIRLNGVTIGEAGSPIIQQIIHRRN